MVRASKARVRTSYRCQDCGHDEPKWLGRCPQCQNWNSLVEEIGQTQGRGVAARPAAAIAQSQPVSIAEAASITPAERLATGIAELDRVLGGGLVPGSLTLLGGDPGVGKSTLLSQCMEGILQIGGGNVLYASGEESVSQAGLRAHRVGATHPGLYLHAENDLERVLSAAETLQPRVLAIDSIQTVYVSSLDSVPGSVGQVRECAGRLLAWAKTVGIPVILVGHVTKEGSLAGPKTLEHVVDTVLTFEGEGESSFRLLRANKNRFGSTQDVGVFEMRASGLCEVPNPSELFLEERAEDAPGSVVVASSEGTRPILVEVQALVAPASAGVGRRTSAGVDGNRVSLLLAVLARRAGIDIIAQDVFVNVAGGVRLTEPAVDLGVASALASSVRGRPIDPGTVVIGEVGLAGEVRAISLPEVRIGEAAKLGFKRCILPAKNLSRLEGDFGVELVGVKRLDQALDLF